MFGKKKAKEDQESIQSGSVKTRRTKKKKRRIILWVVIVAAAAVVIASKILGGNKPQAVVTTQPVEIGEIEQTIRTSGTVTTLNSKTYFSDVNVRIGKVEVAAGDAVKAGDILLTYDQDSLEQETELAQLKLQATEGSYKNSVQSNNEKLGDLKEAGVNLEVLEQQIADTEAQIKRLEDRIAQKKSDLAHEGALLQISLIDWQNQPDSDEYKELQKQVQLNSYEQQNNKDIKAWQDELDAHNKMLSEYKEYRSEMKSQKNSAEAGKMNAGAKEELEASNQTKEIEATDSLENLEAVKGGIVAEFNGVITEMNAVEGASAAQGTQILKLESTEDVMVKISVTKYDLAKIAVGQEAVITIGSKEYQGKVSKIHKMAVKNNSGATVVDTEIKLTNPDSDVILGAEAKVVISTSRESQALLVPVTAVNVDADGQFVYVVEDNILVRKPVSTGISSDAMIQITEGISEGEQVVLDVTAGLEEGMTVMVMPQ